ncbi:hypothetical protein VU08_04640 [Desulfobulbus sp. F5]|nr:hypothetical protein [Desulfobulbus sp. F5]
MNHISKTDWAALESMTDEEIDYSDVPHLPKFFFERAELWHPKGSLREHPAFGLWRDKQQDGLNYQKCLRDEWSV